MCCVPSAGGPVPRPGPTGPPNLPGFQEAQQNNPITLMLAGACRGGAQNVQGALVRGTLARSKVTTNSLLSTSSMCMLPPTHTCPQHAPPHAPPRACRPDGPAAAPGWPYRCAARQRPPSQRAAAAAACAPADPGGGPAAAGPAHGLIAHRAARAGAAALLAFQLPARHRCVRACERVCVCLCAHMRMCVHVHACACMCCGCMRAGTLLGWCRLRMGRSLRCVTVQAPQNLGA